MQVGRADLRVVAGAASPVASELDAEGFEAACVYAFIASWAARGFSPVFIGNAAGVLERFLVLLAVPAWEAGPDDVDAVVAQLVANGLAASTRRGYVQAFKDFHRFLTVRKAPEIEATFGVHLLDPVDEFNAPRHIGNDSPSQKAPPSPARMEEFFEFSASPLLASSARPGVTTPSSGRFITLVSELTKPPRSSWPTFTSGEGRSARSTSASGRAGEDRVLDRAGPDARSSRSDPALVRRRCPHQAPGIKGVVLRRRRRPNPPRHDPQSPSSPAPARGLPARGAVQSARPPPQLRYLPSCCRHELPEFGLK